MITKKIQETRRRWEATGANSRKETQETKQDMKGLREKENLRYRSVGRMLAWYAEVLGSIPTTTIITKKWEHGDILASSLASERPI